ncbi:glycosyltransferase family 2 protein [Flavobacterium sp. LB3P45]|uniref:Glycosyltransferase family 2 protein n=1 Tax=Flavobacterium fructosi TaxID=3230416 RepID=A0ABW6HLT8_9FLAO
MVAAVVVLYNPETNIVDNISSYIDFVEKVYIVDNSNFSNESLFQALPLKDKIEYVFNRGNLGIAKALNIGCQLAIQQGVKWLLTMDQDSKFLNLDRTIISQISKIEGDRIALYYPTYLIEGVVYDKYIKENNSPIVVMTSGNFINLNVYRSIGGFEDKLFIDYVDIDYCLKIKAAGYSIALLRDAILAHELGHSKHLTFLSIKAIVTNHSSLRRYYITRNRMYVYKKHKTVSTVFSQTEKRIFINDILKIILFEDDKILKFKSIIKGYLDYRNNKFGVYIK